MNQKVEIDFYVLETGNPKTLSIFDNSDWSYSENLPSYLVIKTPGSKKDNNYSLLKNAINTLNSHNLGLSCFKGNCQDEEYVELPDGIYTITLKSGFEGIEETKYYLKTDRFELDFAKKVRESKEDLFVNDMMRIHWYLVVAKAHTKLGEFAEADRFFTDAQNKLKNMNCGTNKCN